MRLCEPLWLPAVLLLLLQVLCHLMTVSGEAQKYLRNGRQSYNTISRRIRSHSGRLIWTNRVKRENCRFHRLTWGDVKKKIRFYSFFRASNKIVRVSTETKSVTNYHSIEECVEYKRCEFILQWISLVKSVYDQKLLRTS